MQLYGHRGAKGEAPENTLAGFEYLRKLGIHRVELDIRLSQDNELIVLHDETVDRTTNGTGHVRKHSANQLATLDARKTQPQWPNPSGVPTLKSVLTNWPELKSIQLEVKATQASVLNIIAEKLHDLIDALNIEEQAIITSSHQGFLKLSRRRGDHIAHGFVAERFCRNPLGIVRNLHCQYLCAHYKLLTAHLVEQAHKHEVFVSAWTVNTVEEAGNLIKIGVDSIISDIPSLFSSDHPR